MNSTKANELNRAAASLRRKKPEECARLAEEAIAIAERENDPFEQAKGLHNLSEANVWNSCYDEALTTGYEAKEYFQQLGEYESLGDVHYTLGTVFYYLSDYNHALEEYMRAFKAFESAGSKLGQAKAYNGIGSVYYSIGENRKSIHYLTTSFDICREADETVLLQKVLDGLGKAYANIENYEKALEYLEDCVALITKNEDSDHVKAHALNSIGEIHLKLEDYDAARKHFERSLRLRESIGFVTGWADCLANMGKAEIALQKWGEALTSLESGLELAKTSQSKSSQLKIYHLLSEVYEAKGDFSKALEHFKAYHAIREELNAQNTDRTTKSLQMKFKMEQEEHEKQALEDKNKKLEQYSNDLVQLSEVGKRLTAILSPEQIIREAYDEINQLMDAPSYGLGIYDEKTNTLNFPGYCEDGEILGDLSYSLNEEGRLAAICYHENRDIVIGNIAQEYSKYIKSYKPPKAGRKTASIIYLPFQIPNGASGVITVQSYRKHAYNEHHVSMLKNLAVFMAIALENAQLYVNLEQKVNERTKEITEQKEEIEKSYRMTALLSEVGRQLTSSTDFESIFLKLHQNVSDLMDASCFGVRLYKPEENHIEYKFEIENGVVDREPIYVSMDDENNYSVLCVKNNQVIFINDNQKEYQKYTKEIVVPTGEMPHSLIFYPMNFGGRVIGLITVQSFQRHAFNDQHLQILKTLASFTAIALENVNLVDNLESKVEERTAEIVAQKEEVERTHEHTQLLNEIGREITSTLSVEDVLEKVYANINKLMDASIIGVGIRNKDKLEMKGAIENGEKLPDFYFNLDDENALAVHCLLNKKEMFITNLDEQIDQYIPGKSTTKVGEKPQSIMYIPLIVKNKGIGTISVQSFEPNAYNEYHLNILRNLAVYTSTAFENAMLYDQMERKVVERTREVVQQKEEVEKTYLNTKLLSEMGQNIISTHDLEQIFDKMHQNVNKLMDATIFSIRICDYDKHEIDYRYTMESGNRLDSISISMDDYDNYSVWCLRNKKEILINDHAKDYKKYTNKIIVVDGELPESLIFCPMMIGDRVIGIISAQSFEKHAYTEYHLDILRTIATYSAIALENANLIQDMENQVKIRTAEVVKQKEIIEEKNKDITDSIQYAQRIQNVILPPLAEFQENFVESFVFFRPRDIVSGDFYWIEEIDNKIYFAVVDCTGHGVPGALVSVVGANSLNRCLMEFELKDPGAILNKLSELVKDTFEKSESNVRDGMDMALCCIDKDTREIAFSGAYNPLWIVREGTDLPIDPQERLNLIEDKGKTLIEIKSTKQPIGHSYRSESFETKKIQLEPSDMVYLFSDGYADQFGGHEEDIIARGGKKFKTTKFKDLLLSISHTSLNDQRSIIEETFDTWKGRLEQVDDVCVIGVRL
ncbi:MAG: GAF domain-containing protein [Bacteroidota bacterium]